MQYRAGRSSATLDVLESTLIAVLISLALTAGFSRLTSSRLVWLAAIVIPIAVAYALYWGPIWSKRGDNAQYGLWAPVAIASWSIPSSAACLLLVGILSWRRRRGSSTSNQRLERP
jgi:hypothetical protein